MKFIFYRELNAMDAGPACLQEYYGQLILSVLSGNWTQHEQEAVPMLPFAETAESIGLNLVSSGL